MAPELGTVRVVAAVLVREGRYLVAQRPEQKRHGGLWEFPGGKVLAGESRADAIRRELAEELSLEVSSVGGVLFTTRDGESPFVIDFVEAMADGAPTAHEHDAVAWLTPSELHALELAPADASFVSRLRLD